jgi:hypothetical protein
LFCSEIFLGIMWNFLQSMGRILHAFHHFCSLLFLLRCNKKGDNRKFLQLVLCNNFFFHCGNFCCNLVLDCKCFCRNSCSKNSFISPNFGEIFVRTNFPTT